MSQTADTEHSAAASGPGAAGFTAADLRFLAIAGAVMVVLLVAVFWHFVSGQVYFAINAPSDWGHTLVIPGIAAYFVYLRREDLARAGFKTTWIGLIPMMAGVAWYVACWLGEGAFATLRHHNLMGAGFGLTLFGVVLLFCGWRAMRWLIFPIAYLVIFSQTISEKLMNLVTFQMQDLSAKGAFVLLNVVGIDTDLAGNTLTVWERVDGVMQGIPLNVAEACSGMRMLMAFLALGAAMAYTGLRYRWQQIALVALAAPTAIFVNVLRVASLGGLALVNPNFAGGETHEFIGLLWLLPAFLIYLGVMWVLQRLVVETPTARAEAGS